ncbi:hypothetical protein [Deminuibacter soli]|uniref:BZIP transcription factor n=1 Tax=Deminuibacter soli TaxID=2291815 RepID=A0A3E1NJ40_9BACT|nr:hypothetical protein [Deminuibacter soli]RFM27949.1 hypothetical protein DXN05_10405 [Deminuibacter soli]
MRKLTALTVALFLAHAAGAQWSSATGGTNADPIWHIGTVGINNNTPLAPLDVGNTQTQKVTAVLSRLLEGTGTDMGTCLDIFSGATLPVNTSSFSLEHRFYGLVNSAVIFNRGADRTGGYLTFATNDGTEKMRLDKDGRMGLGTTAPRAQLHVYAASAANTWTGRAMFGNEVASPFIGSYGTIPVVGSVDASSNFQKLYLNTVNGVAGAEVVANKLGVGIANPSSTLHVAGPTTLAGTLLVTDVATIASLNTGTDVRVGGKLQVVNNIQLGGQMFWDNPQYRAIQLAKHPDGTSYLVQFTNTMTSSQGNANGGFDFSDYQGTSIMRMANYNVGIGTTNPTAKLSVNGTVLAKQIKVSQSAASWPDYVFAPGYQLPSLDSVAQYITDNKHLPEMPAAKEIETNGQDVGDIQKLMLKKMEEMTLYMIELKKKNEQLEQRNEQLAKRVEQLEKNK